jgi:hypothetical protein
MKHFENKLFDTEVNNFREWYFVGQNEPSKHRWESGHDLSESFKITLAQIYADDDTDIDLHKINIQCERLYHYALKMYFEGGENFKG